MKRKFCPVCFGRRQGRGCHACTQLIIDQKEEEGKRNRRREREYFLGGLWEKARKYNMESLGDPDIDREVKALYGDWKR